MLMSHYPGFTQKQSEIFVQRVASLKKGNNILVEEFIYRALASKKLDCVIAASGSFSRRELSPYSDIDLMIIFKEIAGNEEQIREVVTLLWDVGIEI